MCVNTLKRGESFRYKGYIIASFALTTTLKFRYFALVFLQKIMDQQMNLSS